MNLISLIKSGKSVSYLRESASFPNGSSYEHSTF